MEKIWQSNYLVVENVDRYRLIMRYLYKRHRQMQGATYRPEVLEMMREDYSLDYSELEVDQDLENLVKWGNLQKQQEMVRARSIEEYRNRNFRYQITEAGVLVEEMAYQLEHTKHVGRGSLSEKGFRKLLELLQALIGEQSDPVELWRQIREEFRKIGEDTANYIGYITSPEVDSRMKTEQFLVYKDRFVSYLRDFISSVQSLTYEFQGIIKKLKIMDKEELIIGLYQKEQAIPTFDGISLAEVSEQVLGEFEALQNWFIGTTNRPSEYANLMTQTNQMITKITGLIYYYGQEIHQYQSRKKDYLQLAKWFAKAESLPEAQKMYAGIFGVSHSRHYFVSEGSDATNTRENSWELAPGKLHLSKRGRGARNEYRAHSVKLDKAIQQAKVTEYQKEQANHRQRIDAYFQEGQLDFSTVQNLDRHSRQVFLKWISKAIASERAVEQEEKSVICQKISTELGFEVEVSVYPQERIIVSGEDGQLEMPKVIMERSIR